MGSTGGKCFDIGWLRVGCAHWQPTKGLVVPTVRKPVCLGDDQALFFEYSGKEYNMMNMTAARNESFEVCKHVFCDGNADISVQWCMFWVQALFMSVLEEIPECVTQSDSKCSILRHQASLINCDWKQRIVNDVCPFAKVTKCVAGAGLMVVSSELQYEWLVYATSVWSAVIVALLLSLSCCVCMHTKPCMHGTVCGVFQCFYV